MHRNLPTALEPSAMHTFSHKIPVPLMNRREVDKLPGELLVYHASFDSKNSRSMRWPGVPVLQVKWGCKVIVVWNKSAT